MRLLYPLAVAAVLACGLLPGEVYAYWRSNSGYIVPGLPVRVYVRGVPGAWFVDTLGGGRTELLITLPIEGMKP